MKGKTFTADDLPRGCRWSDERKAEWCAEQTKRYEIVGHDGDYPMIAEEVEERTLRKLGEAARPLARMLLGLSVQQRLAVLGAFDEQGKLRLIG